MKKKFLTKRSCFQFFLIGTFCLLFNSIMAQQPVTQKEASESFAKFFKTDKITPAGFDSLQTMNKVMIDRIKRSPDRESKLDRLLFYQEHKQVQSNVLDIANSPLLLEVSEGEEVEFAQVIAWNSIAMDITAIDHTALPAESLIDFYPFEQVGPARTSRALAIVHIAIFEAINAVYRQYESYNGIQSKIFAATGISPAIPISQVSIRHAIAYASYSTLVALYPKKKQILDLILLYNITLIQKINPQIAENGQRIGTAAANVILELRKNDRSTLPDPFPVGQFFPNNNPELWHKDPLNDNPDVALGANWKYVTPFVLEKAEQFRPTPPPPINSDSFKMAYKEVFNLGGDPFGGLAIPPGNERRRPTPTTRTSDQTFIGKYWAYDGTALLCAPPRLYNMIATSLALKEKRSSFKGTTSSLKLARYLALINITMADAGIGAWEAKYHYLFPRPVTFIRENDPSPYKLPVGANVKFWTPLGAPVTNGRPGSLNFTPPFPAYPSGHATFGGALFEIFRKYWGTDNISFEFISDEYNGLNYDPGEATPRPLKKVTFKNFSIPEKLNADSRIYLGVHWKFDADAGIVQGNKIADFVFDKIYKEVVIELPKRCEAGFTNQSEGLKGFVKSNLSYIDPGDSIISRNWYWGDGNVLSGNLAEASYEYKKSGQYEVCLVIKTKYGCEAKTCRIITVPDLKAICLPYFNNEVLPNRKVGFKSGGAVSQLPGDSIVKRIWNFGDGATLSGNVINPLYEYKFGGTYTVCLTIVTKLGCESKYCKTIEVKGGVITEDAFVKLVSLYPNPAKNVLYPLVWSKNPNVKAELAVIDVYGRVKWAQTVTLPQGNSNWQIPVQSLLAGPYILRISTMFGVRRANFYKMN